MKGFFLLELFLDLTVLEAVNLNKKNQIIVVSGWKNACRRSINAAVVKNFVPSRRTDGDRWTGSSWRSVGGVFDTGIKVIGKLSDKVHTSRSTSNQLVKGWKNEQVWCRFGEQNKTQKIYVRSWEMKVISTETTMLWQRRSTSTGTKCYTINFHCAWWDQENYLFRVKLPRSTATNNEFQKNKSM